MPMNTTADTTTAGQALTAELRWYFRIGPRTRQYRDSKYTRLADRMVEAIAEAATLPGCYSPRTAEPLSKGYAVAIGYSKHVKGYRINPTKIAAITAMSPWRFAGFLGEMVDAGITNTGEAERFYSEWQAA
jgi:hypothetical protein